MTIVLGIMLMILIVLQVVIAVISGCLLNSCRKSERKYATSLMVLSDVCIILIWMASRML